MRRRALFGHVQVLCVWALLVSVAPTSVARAERPEKRIQLPEPTLVGSMSLEEAMASRRSRRRVSKEPLDLATVGQLLWAAQGITLPSKGFRTAPSAGARYPLRLYVLLPTGLFAYEPKGHQLVHKRETDLRRLLWTAVYARPWLVDAPAIVLVAADSRRTKAKYGAKAERFVHIEAGHAAQNLLLQSTGLGLHGVGVGAFNGQRCKEILGLPKPQELLYVLIVGKPPKST